MKTDQFNLTIITGDQATEKFIIDSRFHRVALGVGAESNFKLPAGLYSVKVRAGSEYQEKAVALFKDETVIFDPVPFSSPAPLKGTGKSNELYMSSAADNSTTPGIRIGNGSQLYVFISNRAGMNEQDPAAGSNSDPAAGLTLRNAGDQILVDFGSPSVGLYSTGQDPWSACNVALDPGVYTLCLDTAAGDIFKQTIVVSPSWQTQVFIQQHNYELKESSLRADLSNDAIFMSGIGYGFQPGKDQNYPDDPDFRLTEMLRQALVSKRNVLSDEVINSMLSGKFSNPMLGIYGAHLLMLGRKPDTGILPAIVNNLRNLLVQPHPDVEAIALKLNMPGNYIFETFPMLFYSWSYVLEASVQRPEIVPEGSPAAEFTGQLCGNGPWLIRRQFNKEDDNRDSLLERAKKITQLSSFQNIPDIAPGQMAAAGDMAHDDEGIAAASSVVSAPDSNIAAPKLNDEQMLPMVQALGVPRAKVEAMLKEVNLNEPDNISKKAMDNVREDTINDDPQKGKWGGEAERNSRRLSAEIKASETRTLYMVTITVASTNDAVPLTGVVKFHLHDTFLNPDPVVTVQDNKAVLKLTGVWGGFTVGAEADDGATKLELDLSRLAEAPQEFRER